MQKGYPLDLPAIYDLAPIARMQCKLSWGTSFYLQKHRPPIPTLVQVFFAYMQFFYDLDSTMKMI